MFRYEQKTGIFSQVCDSGLLRKIGVGYAGHGEGINNPDMQHVHNVGPLPVGFYTIGEPYWNPHTGQFTMNLTPDPRNEMFGRSLFRIHGDNRDANRTASDGCIVLAHDERVEVHRLTGLIGSQLEVVRGF